MGDATEAANPRTRGLDLRSTAQIVAALLAEERTVPDAVGAVADSIARAAEVVADRLAKGGRLHSFGAGTSGRLAALDAAELGPTFGVAPGVVVAHVAGAELPEGPEREAAEDDEAAGAAAARPVAAADVAIGVAASGATPYVRGALLAARAAGAATVLVSASPGCALGAEVDIHIAPDTGAEALAGSTRLKAGTAAKVVLNAISTAAMVRLGRTYDNFMVDLEATNAKLRRRAVRILREAAGLDDGAARTLLDAAGGELPTALVMSLGEASAAQARAMLVASAGSVRLAIERCRAAPPSPGR